MDREQYLREKEQFSAWAAENEHNIMPSFPKSGRNHLGNMIRQLSGRIVIPGICPLDPILSLSDVFLFMAHMARWEIRGDKGRYILLIRDPRDAILSRTYQQAIETEVDAERLLATPAWVIENIMTWKKYFPTFMPYDPYIVQYEKLMLKPVRILNGIFDFLGIEQVEDVMRIIARNDLVKPNPMELRGFVPRVFKTGRERYSAHCLKWQRDPIVGQRFLDTVWREARGAMQRFGYTERGHSDAF